MQYIKLSMLADDKVKNLKDKKIKLLKSIIIYGANVSGKSNLIYAFEDFTHNIIQANIISKINGSGATRQ